MSEQVDDFLDEEGPSETLRAEMPEISELLRSQVDHGANLVKRILFTRKPAATLEDAILVAALLRQVTSMYDAIEILVRAGAVPSAAVPLRVMYEAALFFRWMLRADTERRAKYYYVGSLRRYRDLQTSLDPDSGFSKDLEEAIDGYDELDDLSRYCDSKSLLAISNKLDSKEFRAINDHFDQDRAKRKVPFDAAWHSLADKVDGRNVKTIARSMDWLLPYRFVYGNGSSLVHSKNHSDHFIVRSEGLTLKSLRSVGDVKMIVNFSTAIFERCVLEATEHFRGEELEALRRKWREEWAPLKERIRSKEIRIVDKPIRFGG